MCLAFTIFVTNLVCAVARSSDGVNVATIFWTLPLCTNFRRVLLCTCQNAMSEFAASDVSICSLGVADNPFIFWYNALMLFCCLLCLLNLSPMLLVCLWLLLVLLLVLLLSWNWSWLLLELLWVALPILDCSAWCSPLPDKFQSPFAGGGLSCWLDGSARGRFLLWLVDVGYMNFGNILKFSPWKPHLSLASSLAYLSSQLFRGSLHSSSGILSSLLWGVVYPATYGVLLGGVLDFVSVSGTPVLPFGRGVLAYFLSGYQKQ